MEWVGCSFVPSSLKQSGMHTGNPWPPYKESTPLHPCYRGLARLLHCKTLHIVIFTLLYKVSRLNAASHPVLLCSQTVRRSLITGLVGV